MVARIRPAAGEIARVLLLGWALTTCLYSQSLSFTRQPPVPAGRQEFDSPAETCRSRLFNPGYATNTSTDFRFHGLSLSSRPVQKHSSGCDPFGLAGGNQKDLENGDAWDKTIIPAEFGGLTAGDQSESGTKPAPSSVEKSSPGHIFWVVPAFHVAYAKQFKPLTPREKFDEWVRGTYDPRGLGLYALESATLEHSSSDGFCGYGHGWGGYGKCFGSVELDANISSFFGDFLFPVVMHQDPRYFRLGEGSFGKRMGYAISRVFVTHADSGRWVFSSSALSGSVLAAAASNLYYPVQDRGFSSSVSRMGLDLGDTALFNVAAEFWPDIKRKIGGVF